MMFRKLLMGMVAFGVLGGGMAMAQNEVSPKAKEEKKPYISRTAPSDELILKLECVTQWAGNAVILGRKTTRDGATVYLTYTDASGVQRTARIELIRLDNNLWLLDAPQADHKQVTQ